MSFIASDTRQGGQLIVGVVNRAPLVEERDPIGHRLQQQVQAQLWFIQIAQRALAFVRLAVIDAPQV